MIQQRHRDEATRKHAILATECKASRNERSAFFSRTMNYEEWQAASKQAEIAMAATDAAKAMEVQPSDLEGYGQVHFFAGIGGWSLALRLAGVPDTEPVWTGSCPCQPFSAAGKRKGHADERHLWPEMFRLVRQRRPARVLGEQVAAAIGHGWLDGVFTDLEGEGYAFGSAVLGAHSVGAPHIRQRCFWVADAAQRGLAELRGASDARSGGHADGSVEAGGISNTIGVGQLQSREEPCEVAFRREAWEDTTERGSAGGLPNAPGIVGQCGQHQQERESQGRGPDRRDSPWSNFIIIQCGDGKARRIEPGLSPLVDGLPGRVGLLRGYGNAIVPQVAAEFIRAVMEVTPAQLKEVRG